MSQTSGAGRAVGRVAGRAAEGRQLEPRELAEQIERDPVLPPGIEERFAGYGVMGAPFRSGDILAMRRFPASSIGGGYKSVWHRTPEGAWTMWSDRPTLESCPRYFGSALARSSVAAIELRWRGSRRLEVRVDEARLSWEIELEANASTRFVNALSRAVPERAWRSPRFLAAMARVASRLLHAGHLALSGIAPNGQSFIANPMEVWVLGRSRAVIDGRDLGEAGAAPTQARLGDFWIPQQGLFAFGRAFFERTDATKHRLVDHAGT